MGRQGIMRVQPRPLPSPSFSEKSLRVGWGVGGGSRGVQPAASYIRRPCARRPHRSGTEPCSIVPSPTLVPWGDRVKNVRTCGVTNPGLALRDCSQGGQEDGGEGLGQVLLIGLGEELQAGSCSSSCPKPTHSLSPSLEKGETSPGLWTLTEH